MTKTELARIMEILPDDAHSIIIKGRTSREVFFTTKAQCLHASAAIPTPGWGYPEKGSHRMRLELDPPSGEKTS